ncbi:hypothetical protein I302_100940 [Kwoniella bestiolae CBS 10118]|uniref:Uncharacterized protein n=1 Tax=Kwoniella bestiolae CBS 10118 TaxID=1296100 RepID=A0A1B9G6J1_9TREE|nr:hypothetical protein I302_04316 [Kwoniella bestiolae CBS 10118]OCF26630.1 hypothetical protein I302_04316 [Kwoniella bestiolae CBS 10118]
MDSRSGQMQEAERAASELEERLKRSQIPETRSLLLPRGKEKGRHLSTKLASILRPKDDSSAPSFVILSYIKTGAQPSSAPSSKRRTGLAGDQGAIGQILVCRTGRFSTSHGIEPKSHEGLMNAELHKFRSVLSTNLMNRGGPIHRPLPGGSCESGSSRDQPSDYVAKTQEWEQDLGQYAERCLARTKEALPDWKKNGIATLALSGSQLYSIAPKTARRLNVLDWDGYHDFLMKSIADISDPNRSSPASLTLRPKRPTSGHQKLQDASSFTSAEQKCLNGLDTKRTAFLANHQQDLRTVESTAR